MSPRKHTRAVCLLLQGPPTAEYAQVKPFCSQPQVRNVSDELRPAQSEGGVLLPGTKQLLCRHPVLFQWMTKGSSLDLCQRCCCSSLGPACTLLQLVITLPAWAGPQQWLDLAPDPLSPEMRLLEGAGLLLFLPLSVALILRALVWDYTVMKPSTVWQNLTHCNQCIGHRSYFMLQ